jgi:hypothetical protein
MTAEKTLPWILFQLPEEKQRGFSYERVVEWDFEPREYRSLINAVPMTAEALLDFKVWGKTPNLTCFFRNIKNGNKFRLTAFDTNRNSLYTPRDKGIDFSEKGNENGLYLVSTVKTRKGQSVWYSATLLLGFDRKDEILTRIAEVYTCVGK